MKGPRPLVRGAAPFVREHNNINLGHGEVKKTMIPKYPESDAGLLKLAQVLWTESFLRKMHTLLKEETHLLSQPRALVKGLFLLSPLQRNLLDSWEKGDQELADELCIPVVYVSAQKKKCFKRLAEVTSDLRAYIVTLPGIQSVPVDLHFSGRDLTKKKGPYQKKTPAEKLLARIPKSLRPAPNSLPANEGLSLLGPVLKTPRWQKNLRPANNGEKAASKERREKPAGPGNNFIGGWQKRFLEEELEIETPILKKDWERAFNGLYGSERDVVRFHFAKGKSFFAFSREKYGTAGRARDSYKKAVFKILDALTAP